MVKKIAENFNRLSRVHQRYRQTTDGRPIAYSEREREFTSANNLYLSRSIYFEVSTTEVITMDHIYVFLYCVSVSESTK